MDGKTSPCHSQWCGWNGVFSGIFCNGISPNKSWNSNWVKDHFFSKCLFCLLLFADQGHFNVKCRILFTINTYIRTHMEDYPISHVNSHIVTYIGTYLYLYISSGKTTRILIRALVQVSDWIPNQHFIRAIQRSPNRIYLTKLFISSQSDNPKKFKPYQSEPTFQTESIRAFQKSPNRIYPTQLFTPSQSI